MESHHVVKILGAVYVYIQDMEVMLTGVMLKGERRRTKLKGSICIEVEKYNYRLLSRDGVEIRKMKKYISKTYVVFSLEDLYSLIAAHTRHLGPILSFKSTTSSLVM